MQGLEALSNPSAQQGSDLKTPDTSAMHGVDSCSVAYHIVDALGLSPKARGEDPLIDVGIRDVVAEAGIMNAVVELGRTQVSNPAVDATLFALALVHRESTTSQFAAAVTEALTKRSMPLQEVVASLKSEVLSQEELRLLSEPQTVSAEDARNLIKKIKGSQARDEMKVALLAPLAIYGDIESEVRTWARDLLRETNEPAYRALCMDYVEPPF